VLAQFTLLIILTAFNDHQVHEFGWRIGFAIGGLAAVVVFWLRRTMDESLSEETLAAVREGKDPGAGSMRELLTRYRRPLLLCFLITLGGTVAFYTYSVNAPTIVKATYKSEAMTATWINLAGLIFLMLLQPVGGMISDKVGRKPLLLWFGIGGLFYTYVLITYLPETRSPIMSFLLVAVGYVILTGYTSINALVKSELFPAHVRALGVGLGYALANSMFGGTAPLIYQAMKARDQVPLFIGYVTVCIAVSLVVYIFFIKNKSETYLDREQGAAFG
jgi:MHS family alpha-ketoglutarate permease-like MFS transporter